MPSSRQARTSRSAAAMKAIRFGSAVVAIPLSVTRTGVPPVLCQARRMVLPRACG